RGDEAAEAAVELVGVAKGEGVDRLVDGEGGGVADDRADIGDLDLALAGGIEAKLCDFGTAGEAIGAKEIAQRRARVGADRQSGAAGFLIDDAVEVFSTIGIA